MEWKFSGINFFNFGYALRGCPNIPENWNNWEILFHSAIPTLFYINNDFEDTLLFVSEQSFLLTEIKAKINVHANTLIRISNV